MKNKRLLNLSDLNQKSINEQLLVLIYYIKIILFIIIYVLNFVILNFNFKTKLIIYFNYFNLNN